MQESTPPIDVEILYHPECGHLEETRAAVRQALEDLHVSERARIREYAVDTLEEARDVGLRGSPTVRINGSDVEEWENRPRLHCREFPGPGGRPVHHPAVSSIRAAIEDAPEPRYDFEREAPGVPEGTER